MRISDWSSDVCSSDLFAWCLFDWANSSYPTVIVTFVFAAYFTQGVAASPEAGTAQWGLMLSLSGLALALLAPVLGAIADQGGGRKPWIGAFTALAVADRKSTRLNSSH